MEKQLNYYIQKHLYPCLCEYQKGHSTQQALLAVIESLKQNLENKCFGARSNFDRLVYGF